MIGCLASIILASGWFSVTMDDQGISTLVNPKGNRTFLVGVEHLFKQQPHEFANTNWASEVFDNLKAWNFNFLGAGPIPELRKSGMPYSVIAWISEAMTRSDDEDDYIYPMHGTHVPCSAFPNVFSPKWPSCAAKAAQMVAASVKDDPNFVGYDLDNELKWWGAGAFGNDTNGLFAAVAALPQNHSAYRALIDFVNEHQTSITSATEEIRRAFVAEICERFFRTATEALRKEDPNHLILGVRFAGLGGPREAWKAAGKYCDIVSFNIYPWVDLDANWVKSGCDYWGGRDLRTLVEARQRDCARPMLITEWGTSSIDSGLPCLRAVGERFRTQAERTSAAEAMLREFASWPFLVGVSWFRYRDNEPYRESSEDCNWGLVNLVGRPYPELTRMFTHLNEQSLHLHLSGSKPQRHDPGDRGFPRAGDAYKRLATGETNAISCIPIKDHTLQAQTMDGRKALVSLSLVERKPNGKLRWIAANRVSGCFTSSDGSLIVTNKTQAPNISISAVTRWRTSGLYNAVFGEILSVHNHSNTPISLDGIVLRLTATATGGEQYQNESWGRTVLWQPLRAAGWIEASGSWSGALTAAPLADYSSAGRSAFSQDNQILSAFRFSTIDAQTPRTLLPHESWTSNERAWIWITIGHGGENDWLTTRDAFERKFFPALGRLPIHFPLSTKAGEMRHAKGHFQGVAATNDYFYLSTAYSIAKISWDGHILREIQTSPHVGDICLSEGKLYATVDSWEKDVLPHIDVYDTELNRLGTHHFDINGLDGICRLGDDLLVGWGNADEASHMTNRIARIDAKTFTVKEIKEFSYGHPMHWGIQNLTTDGKNIYATVYPADLEHLGVLILDNKLNVTTALSFEAGHGFEVAPNRFSDGKNRFIKVCTDYDWQQSTSRIESAKARLRLYEQAADGTLIHLNRTF